MAGAEPGGKEQSMILQKKPGQDFVLLNLSDPQISTENLREKNKHYTTMCGTIHELIKQVQPDLITISGDLTYGGSDEVYEFYADFMDSLNIPWAFVWGNHDNQAGKEATRKAEAIFENHPLCLFEKGDEQYGSGNYILEIREGGRPVEAIFMMDTHDREPYGDQSAWGKLQPEQIEWYRARVAELKAKGFPESMLITHIPIYAYRDAYKAAFRNPLAPGGRLPVGRSYGKTVWNEGYEDSFGVNWENICSYEAEDGMMDALVEMNHTKHVLAGHDHINNSSICYRGVRLTYALKTGTGCYANWRLNGGTVYRIGENGVCDLYHEYIDPHFYMPAEEIQP